jgi:hypothetical protein
MTTLAALLLLVASAGAVTEHADATMAVVDLRRLPATEQPDALYVSYAAARPNERASLKAAVRLMVASSTRQIVVERLVPHEVTPTVDRWDRSSLGWRDDEWATVTKGYPYDGWQGPGVTPQIVRGDWLLVELADATQSEAYYRLLLGKVPKTRDEWLDGLRVVRKGDPLHRFGLIEGESGVAVNSVRWLESFPADRGYAWGTRDSLRTGEANDPLEHPLGDFAHDGEEWIVGIPKVSIATGKRGVLQIYLLSDGKGNRVDKAPVDLVEDSSRFRGRAEIRNPGSCIQCHDQGLREPSRNELREYVESGAELYATEQATQERLEAFHLGAIGQEIARANEDFGGIVRLVTGLAPEDAASEFTQAVRRYDEPLTVEDVARELGVTPGKARAAIALQTGMGKPLGARLSSLAHGGTASRDAVEERYRTLRSYLVEFETPLEAPSGAP